MHPKSMSINTRKSNNCINIRIHIDTSMCMYICVSTNITINTPLNIRIGRNISIRCSTNTTIVIILTLKYILMFININTSFTDPPFPGFKHVPSTTALPAILSSRAEGQGLGVRGFRFGVWGSFVEKPNCKNLTEKPKKLKIPNS